MYHCKNCGASGAKTLITGGIDLGKYCFKCASKIDKSVHCDDGCSPRYSDDMHTRELYHRLTSAPNSPWRGY